ncbi:Glycoside-Pentoside-Hexuronide (GPH):Cation Symporter Family [Achlya hypogyna]|uniref:Glycoside-Pentoside-Hexuronide (GPH):Cation Symporter Family n=1 Tax=Achlya hypogyna TaxID=1202772 RepID=A0A1V9YBD1_ACHHY|nr:Glycoside-Pentoside-Hexuronide (GPH):Cation Symporter Family [Achlya hypogyna]
MMKQSSSLDDNGEVVRHVASTDLALVTQASSSSPVEGCSLRFLLLLCAPRMAINMAWAAQWAALAPLLQTLLSASSVQLVQLIGPVTGFLIGPTMGVLSDNCTSPYGRRRPFIFWGAWTTALCWVFLMYVDDLSSALGSDSSARTAWKTSLVVIGYIWMDVSVNLTQVPVNLLIADLAGDRQITAASIGGVYAILGSFTISGFVMAFGAAPTHFTAFLAMLLVLLLVTTMLVCYFVPDRPFVPDAQAHSQRQQIGAAFRAVYRGVRQLPHLLRLYAVIVVLALYGFTAYNSAKGQFFGLHVFRGNATGSDTCGSNCSEAQAQYNEGVRLATGLTDTLFNVVGLIYLSFLPGLVRWAGAKTVLASALVPQVAFIVLAFSAHVGLDVVIAVLSAITQNTIFPMTMPLIIHVVGYGEANQLGLFAGALNSAVCLGQFLNFVTASVLVTTEMGYGLPILVGGLLSLAALVLTLLKFHVNLESI